MTGIESRWTFFLFLENLFLNFWTSKYWNFSILTLCVISRRKLSEFFYVCQRGYFPPIIGPLEISKMTLVTLMLVTDVDDSNFRFATNLRYCQFRIGDHGLRSIPVTINYVTNITLSPSSLLGDNFMWV